MLLDDDRKGPLRRAEPVTPKGLSIAEMARAAGVADAAFYARLQKGAFRLSASPERTLRLETPSRLTSSNAVLPPRGAFSAVRQFNSH